MSDQVGMLGSWHALRHIPTIPVLTRILAVLDEQLLIGMERKTPGQEPEREVAPAPESMSA